MYDRNGWNAIICENHDQPRSVSRYTDDSDQYRFIGFKLMCLLLTTLAGTLYVYQGQELGMRNVPLDWDITEYKDVRSMNHYESYVFQFAFVTGFTNFEEYESEVPRQREENEGCPSSSSTYSSGQYSYTNQFSGNRNQSRDSVPRTESTTTV